MGQDVEMPVMNGLECARRIREYQRTGEMRSNLPIIAASANARVEQIGMALEAGMVSYSFLHRQNDTVTDHNTGRFHHEAIQDTRIDAKDRFIRCMGESSGMINTYEDRKTFARQIWNLSQHHTQNCDAAVMHNSFLEPAASRESIAAS